MERLGSLDAVFLAIETDTCPMTAGQVSIFEGPPPAFDELRTFLDARLRTVPRCRQRVCESWRGLTRPVWVDHAGFDLGEHLFHATLRVPCTEELDRFVERVMTIPLDRSRPLWEMWVIDDVGEGRWAVVGKMHHCVVDGVAGTDLLTALLGDAPVAPGATGVPPPEPSPWQVTGFGLAETVRSAWRRLTRLVRSAAHPAGTWRRWCEIAAGARALWLQPRRRGSPLTGPIGRTRRWAHVDIPLAEVTAVRRVHGGTVNDVVLAATALGFRSLLRSRGAAERGDVMTLMPMSMRAPTAHGLFDNRVAVTHALLPVGTDDPIAVLDALRAHLAEVKASHQTDASTVLLHSGDLVPNRLAARIARGVVRAQRNLETVTTNVPGPRQPLHLCGRRMLAGLPFAPIAGEIRIVVAIWSYCGTLHVGVTGDGAGAADVDVLAAGISEGMQRLVSAVGAADPPQLSRSTSSGTGLRS